MGAHAAKAARVPWNQVTAAFHAIVRAFAKENATLLSADKLVVEACHAGLDQQRHDRLLG